MFNLKSVIAASIISLGSLMGVSGSVQARGLWVDGRGRGSMVTGKDYGSRVNCRPNPSFHSNDGSYVLVGQWVQVVGHYNPYLSPYNPEFTLIEINGNRCWVHNRHLSFWDNF